MTHFISNMDTYTPIEQFGVEHPNDLKRMLSHYYKISAAAEKLNLLNDERVLTCADWHELKKILKDIKNYG